MSSRSLVFLANGARAAMWSAALKGYNTFSNAFYCIEHCAFAPDGDWRALDMRVRLSDRFIGFARQYSGRDLGMSVHFLIFCNEEIHRLTRLMPDALRLPEEEQSPLLNDGFAAELKEMIKKGERLNFKLIQQLSDKVEELGGRLYETGGAGDALQELEQLRSQSQTLVLLLLEVFDLLDLMRSAGEQRQSREWADSIEGAVASALDMLGKFGIAEIPALGLLFDPYTMEGIGSVPLSEAPSPAKQYEVLTVAQRGFRYAANQQLIRKAKVITLL